MIQLFDEKNGQKRKTERFGCWLLMALAGFYALVCTPVYILSVTNIVISNGIFPILWDFVQSAVQFFYYWTAFAFTLYFSVQYSLKDAKEILTVYGICSVGRYLFSLLIGNLMTLDFEAMGSDLGYMALDVLGDWLQMGLACLLIYTMLLRNKEKRPSAEFLRFSRLTEFSNPVQRCALAVAFIPSLLSILARIRYDIFYGAPQSGTGDLLWMIFYYSGDLLSGVVGYLILFLMIAQLNLKNEEADHRGE